MSRSESLANLTDVSDSDGSVSTESDYGFPLAAHDDGKTGKMFEHVQPIIDSLPSVLTDDERQTAIDVIKRNADIFSKHEFDLGRTNLMTHRIDVGNSEPVAQPLRSHPRAYLDIIDQTVDKMLQFGIVEPSSSAWQSNIVLVSKKDGSSPRMTIDYRFLNEKTKKTKFPLAKTSDCLRALGNSLY